MNRSTAWREMTLQMKLAKTEFVGSGGDYSQGVQLVVQELCREVIIW